MNRFAEHLRESVEEEHALVKGERCSSDYARRIVHRVLSEMRSPTPEMIEDAWQAMIAQALK